MNETALKGNTNEIFTVLHPFVIGPCLCSSLKTAWPFNKYLKAVNNDHTAFIIASGKAEDMNESASRHNGGRKV